MAEYFPARSYDNPFNEKQWRTLLSIFDAFVPALDDAEIEQVKATLERRVVNAKIGAVEAYLKTSASDTPEFTSYFQHQFANLLPHKVTKQIAGALDLLQGGIINYLFCGTTTAYHELDRKTREGILISWSKSYVTVYRTLFDSLRLLTMSAYLKTASCALEAMEYPRIPSIITPRPPKLPDFKFEEFGGIETASMDVDVVVVGSGSGGGVVASKLARKGYKVAVVEKGRFFPHEKFPFSELDGSERLFEGGGFIPSDDGAGSLLAGNTWGGGTTINWTVSLQLSYAVRTEWSEKYGLTFAETPQFQQSFDRVSERMGVSTSNCKHNAANTLLAQGAGRIGFRPQALPRNTAGAEHYCGSCSFGCPTAEKQGGTVTWLADAQRSGAKCIQNCYVERVLLGSGNRARGVECVVDGKTRLTINAKRTIISAGSLHTPCILLRSGVKNKNIGTNLKVHPSGGCVGVFDKRELKAWEGPCISNAVLDLDSIDGQGYGPKLMPMNFHPGTGYCAMPWRGAASWRELSLLYKQAFSILTILRERDSSGTVTPDPDTGKPCISYNFVKWDRQAYVEGVVACCKILVAAGASEIFTFLPGCPSHVVAGDEGIADKRFKDFIALLRKTGSGPGWYSAHQMGSCRMGTSPFNSVADTNGKVWGIGGLYIADGSLFPTSSGGNPMLTVMALADWVAERIIEEDVYD